MSRMIFYTSVSLLPFSTREKKQKQKRPVLWATISMINARALCLARTMLKWSLMLLPAHLILWASSPLLLDWEFFSFCLLYHEKYKAQAFFESHHTSSLTHVYCLDKWQRRTKERAGLKRTGAQLVNNNQSHQAILSEMPARSPSLTCPSDYPACTWPATPKTLVICNLKGIGVTQVCICQSHLTGTLGTYTHCNISLNAAGLPCQIVTSQGHQGTNIQLLDYRN